MARLLRPHIPLEVRCRVVLRQLGEMFPERVLEEAPSLSRLLAIKLCELAALLADPKTSAVWPPPLHLDHDPALGAREKIIVNGEHVGYRPDANDPEHLIYRTKEAHRIKTLVRGEHGQFSDRVLIKRERKRSRKAKAGGKKRWPKRAFPQGRKLGGGRKCRIGKPGKR